MVQLVVDKTALNSKIIGNRVVLIDGLNQRWTMACLESFVGHKPISLIDKPEKKGIGQSAIRREKGALGPGVISIPTQTHGKVIQ